MAMDVAEARSMIDAATAAYAKDRSLANRLALSRAVEAPRQELFRRIHTAPEGGATLVGMREHLLGLIGDDPDLGAIDADLRHLLKACQPWISTLERIDWNTSAAILERLIGYESARDPRDDLRRRPRLTGAALFTGAAGRSGDS
jgi:malonyl-CoA decarboxylase